MATDGSNGASTAGRPTARATSGSTSTTRTTIYLLDIGGYAPELTALTRPLVDFHARKIGAEVFTITERRFPDWDVDYEKMQIFSLAQEREDNWSIYIDSDALIHPNCPDLTELVPRDSVAFHGVDIAPLRFRYDDYFRRDGRNIGATNFFAMASSWCRDLWRPLDDMTCEECVGNIVPIFEEKRVGVRRAHLVTDYAVSRNIARYGLKVTQLLELWPKLGLGSEGAPLEQRPSFFYHNHLAKLEQKIEGIRKTLAEWGLKPGV